MPVSPAALVMTDRQVLGTMGQDLARSSTRSPLTTAYEASVDITSRISQAREVRLLAQGPR